MTCGAAREFLNAYVDGELDLVHNLEVETHLADCAACTHIVENQRALSSAMRSGSLYHAMPQTLQPRVTAALRRAAEPRTRTFRWPFVAVAAGLLLATYFALRLIPGIAPGSPELIAQSILDSHLRSLQPGHLTDVRSSDRHTVKPWFNGKVDFSPPVADFIDQGFPLTGARLDSVAGRKVAVLVYQHELHVINVYVWPAPATADTRVNRTSRQGYNMLYWTKSGLTWWAISDLNSTELDQFATLLRVQ